MNTFEHKPSPKLQIETIKTPEGNEVSFCPERGGIITSIKFKGKEVLYLDEVTFQNTEENVKGGIPILFPNAGPLEGPQYPNLKQHGFARNSKWEATKTGEVLVETLKANNETKKMFPFDFSLRMISNFEEDGSFNLYQLVKNQDDKNEMPISMGLHPYFDISNEEKKNIKFNFKGGDFVEQNFEKWANGKAVSIDNPGGQIEVYFPNLGTLVLEFSEKYQKIWVWSQPGKNFVCVEPVMRDKGGLINDPEMIKPSEVLSLNIKINLKE